MSGRIVATIGFYSAALLDSEGRNHWPARGLTLRAERSTGPSGFNSSSEVSVGAKRICPSLEMESPNGPTLCAFSFAV